MLTKDKSLKRLWKKAFELSLKSFAVLTGNTINEKGTVSLDMIQNDFIAKRGFPKDAIQLAQLLQQEKSLKDKDQISNFAQQNQSITQFLEDEMKMTLLLKAKFTFFC